jgi:uncharacterized protein (DUF1499 family)
MGLVFPACAEDGVGGLPVPEPLDFATLWRPASPNTHLAAPAGGDTPTPPYPVPPERLLAALERVAQRTPRTFPHAFYDQPPQRHWVVRSATFNFPDLVSAEVRQDASGSRLFLYSRSVYGRSDLGANRARVAEWLAALQAELAI